MAENTLIEQLNDAIDAIISGRDEKLAAADPTLAQLVSVAADLWGLPREGFKSRLKAELVSSAATLAYTDIEAATDSEQSE